MLCTPRTDSVATLLLFLPLLDAEAAAVLKHRYGLFKTPQRSIQETSELMHLSVATVYALQHAGIRDLRRLMRN